MDTDFQNLITRFKDFPVVERKPSFLEIARFPHRETVWRNIFAFFFDPKACHGFTDLFLRSFFDAIGKGDQGTGDFDSMTIRTECQTEKGNYLDLLITFDEFAIGIEMKVNADLYNDLEDYGKLVKPKHQDKVNCPADEYKVVLSARSCPERNGFTNLLYSELIAAIQKNLGDFILGADPKYSSFLLDFLNHVTSFIGANAMDIDPKLLQFMQDNHATVKQLIDRHNDLHRCLEGRMADINDAVASLDSIKRYVDYQRPLFSSGGKRLSKIGFKLNGIWFCFQFDVAADYCLNMYFWVDQKTPEYASLDRNLESAGFKAASFTLSQPIEKIVVAIEKTILSMIAFLSEKQAAPAAQ